MAMRKTSECASCVKEGIISHPDNFKISRHSRQQIPLKTAQRAMSSKQHEHAPTHLSKNKAAIKRCRHKKSDELPILVMKICGTITALMVAATEFITKADILLTTMAKYFG